jgi:hypothetical protein
MDSDAKVQVWPSISKTTWDEIDGMAKGERRKFNDMVAILIENAVKERKRKRRNVKAEDPE